MSLYTTIESFVQKYKLTISEEQRLYNELESLVLNGTVKGEDITWELLDKILQKQIDQDGEERTKALGPVKLKKREKYVMVMPLSELSTQTFLLLPDGRKVSILAVAHEGMTNIWIDHEVEALTADREIIDIKVVPKEEDLPEDLKSIPRATILKEVPNKPSQNMHQDRDDDDER